MIQHNFEQWCRRWQLTPNGKVICPCGFTVQAPSKFLSADMKYTQLRQSQSNHYNFCPAKG